MSDKSLYPSKAVKYSIKEAWEDEQGQGMVESALILALIALAVMGSLTAMGQGLKSFFENFLELEPFN